MCEGVYLHLGFEKSGNLKFCNYTTHNKATKFSKGKFVDFPLFNLSLISGKSIIYLAQTISFCEIQCNQLF